MGIIRRIIKKVHGWLCPSLADIIRQFSMGGDRLTATPEQIEELYELIESYGKEDAGEECDKADDEKKRDDEINQ